MITPIHTIQLPDVPIANQQAFLKFIKTYIHTFALERKALFEEANCNAEFFHKDKQATLKIPLLIHSFIFENAVTIRAYTQQGIDTLKFWYALFSEAHPEFCQNVKLKNETCTIVPSNIQHTFLSTNWIPYRKCTYKNGFYYNTAKNEVANFHDTAIGNFRTFLDSLGVDKSIRFKISIEKISKHQPTIALLEKNNEIIKNAFSVSIKITLNLPNLFSLGQNVGYGNGLFVKSNTP